MQGFDLLSLPANDGGDDDVIMHAVMPFAAIILDEKFARSELNQVLSKHLQTCIFRFQHRLCKCIL
jgi:hypothetical protein